MRGIEIAISGLKEGSHFAFAQRDESELGHSICDFVKRGIDENRLNVLFVTRHEAEKYTTSLKKSGVEFEQLAAEGQIAIEPIDELLSERQVSIITSRVMRMLEAFSELARIKGMAGLSIVGRIAGNLSDQGRYEDALLVELFWEKLIPKSDMSITLICPYGSIPNKFATGLQQVHNSPLFIDEVWEITSANFKCAQCGKMVSKEIRIHEPDMMESQSEVLSVAMKEAAAGWIPFCFDCISTHPVLKPSWLNREANLNEIHS